METEVRLPCFYAVGALRCGMLLLESRGEASVCKACIGSAFFPS